MEKISAACAMDWSIKLEKSLRSKNPVKSVESILETGEYLKQWSKESESSTAVYNLFSLIPKEDKLFSNTILIRLVDAFCFGDNLIKTAVVRVFMSMFKLSQGKNFLSKASNHLEILKRVKNVHDKGDTETKALTLILFGCWRDFANEFAPIRYLIFTSMVSSDDVLVRSSLFAAACFSEVADDFALVVLGMLSGMVKFPGILPKTRLAAVRVFAKMGSSHAIVIRAFKICMKLMMESSKDDSLLVPFLVSLTKLASRSTHLASELAGVIMPFLSEDNKASDVRAAVIRCLHFLIKRGMCFSLVNKTETANFPILLKQTELSLDIQFKALQVFQKMLAYKLCSADASEFHQLISIVENASRFQIFSTGCLAISILVDIWKQIVRTAELRSIEVSFTSLAEQIVVLTIERITILGNDPSQANEVQDLFNVLQLVAKDSESLLVVDKVKLLVEKSELLTTIHKFLLVFLENLDNSSLSSQVYEKVKEISDYVRSCDSIDSHTKIVFTLLLHSPILWGFPTVNHEIVSLEYSTQILADRSYWHAYKAGIYAARLGSWVTSAFIFDHLKTNVDSDINCYWLKSLTYLSHAEGKFQLLLLPSDSLKLVNWLRSGNYVPELSKDVSGEFAHSVALHEAYMYLQSSLGMLGNNIVASSELFCFQMWFLVLKTRLLGNVIDLAEKFELLNQDIRKKKHVVEAMILTGCNSLQQLPRISVKLQKLAKEFDTLATCFIDIDDRSSSDITVLSLSCSVLAFASGIVLFLPKFTFGESLPPFTSQSGVCSRLVQDLVQRLWKVDPDICEKLSKLVKGEESVNCFEMQRRSQVLKVCSKVKMLISICSDAVECIYGLWYQLDSMGEEDVMSEITKSSRSFLSQTVMKWMKIPFGIPKYFFNIRPFVGTELFALSSDSTTTITVEQGYQLSLDLCLQLKNIQKPRVPLPLTKLYCILYSKLAYYHTPTRTQHGEETNINKKSYSPWKDEDLVEMSNKLFRHAIKKPEVSDWNNNGVSTIVEFEPNERGQGFSSCLLDVSRFPVGSYQIKWLSCCIDQHGCYWNLLPMSDKPLFKVKKAL